MTADVELLPLPKPRMDASEGGLDWTDDEMTDYARACVANATAAKDAELVERSSTIEALRVELDWQCRLHAVGMERELKLINERDRLRAEVDRLNELCNGLRQSLLDSQAGYVHYRERSERLAEALRGLLDALQDIRGIEIEDYCQAEVAAAQAALHPTVAQENDDA